MRESMPKSDFPDDRAGRRAVRRQLRDGTLLFAYDVFVGKVQLKRGTLIVRLDVDGELFVSIDGM
jgi:hypothetical protein